ncbi:ZZ-type zinc finger-containing protein 3 [Rhizoclosmatium sp. JEL0117]|nr:ZZ-type zinc finger-containing protein 3 [Rhizoclosmatium sp. JEL0117]
MDKIQQDIELLNSTIAVLQNQLRQNELDVNHLKSLKEEALKDPASFVAKLKAKAVRIPTLQNIVAVPDVDIEKYKSKLTAAAAVSYPGNEGSVTDPSQRRRMDLFKPVHYSVFPPISSGAPTDSNEAAPQPDVGTNKRSMWMMSEKISSMLQRLMKNDDPLGLSLLEHNSFAANMDRTSGSVYAENHIAKMEDSDSDVSDIDIDPALKNTDEYMELMKLKVIAKMRAKEQAGSVDRVEAVHHSYSCDSCQISPIVGIRWKCKDCPYETQVDLCNECIRTDFQTEIHKLDHDFEKILRPQEPWDE